ncbi:hypothetical protein [Xenorhabdus kozodoii]|nr:hypothetical protein [Xenorhabdus kozodoii]
MLTKNSNGVGRKKPNGKTLANGTVSALATGITRKQFPDTEYRTTAPKNKQGAISC